MKLKYMAIEDGHLMLVSVQRFTNGCVNVPHIP
jgi:hypothetical protein